MTATEKQHETEQETLQGYVVDMVCLRKYPQDELLQRAREHTKECSTMGHCVESGYGLVDDQGHLAALDPPATPEVLKAIRASERDHGIRLRVQREMQEGEMQTVSVEEVDAVTPQ